MKAIIPATGLGTKFLPTTKAHPKEMLPVYDNPTIQHVVEEAVASGIDDIITVTGRHKQSLEDHFDKYYEFEYNLQKAGKDRRPQRNQKNHRLADICYVRQKEQKGLGDAIKCGERHIGGQVFTVLLGDSITKGPAPWTKQLIDVYSKYHSSAISLEEVPPEKVEQYGIINGNEVEKDIYKISELVEKAPSNLAIMGRYVLTQDIFDRIDETELCIGGEIQLTDALQKLDSIYGATFEGKTYDIGNRLEWLKISIKFALDDTEFGDNLVDQMKSYIQMQKRYDNA